jgi:chromosome partitioning protein
VEVDPKASELTFRGGKSASYGKLVSSIPLPEFIPMIKGAPRDVVAAAELLACTTAVLVNLGINRPDVSPSSWTYFYDDEFPFSRVSYPRNYSPNVVPPGTSSIQAEVYFSRKYRPLQGSAADWIETSEDEAFERVTLVEAPTERMLTKALSRIDGEESAVVDTPPGSERLLAKAIEVADAIVIPTRIGGVETARVEAVLDLVPRKLPVGLVICSARTYTRDYQDVVAAWVEAGVPVWGSVPERVSIAAGPEQYLAEDGLEAYRTVWRRAQRAVRES